MSALDDMEKNMTNNSIRRSDYLYKLYKLKDALKVMRIENNMTQKDVPGYRQAAVSQIENNNRTDMKLLNLMKYADAIGCDVTITLTSRLTNGVEVIKL